MNRVISKTGETENLIISEAVIEECEELQNICNRWDDKLLLEGEEFEADYIYKCITEGDLPPKPDATKDNYNLKAIYTKEGNKLIGFTDIYHGYPKDDTVWISMFVIDKAYRNKGYASEVIDYLSGESLIIGYEKMGIGVNLKNWRGLRFWTKAGFDKVLGVFGDKVYSENTFAVIGLEKRL